MFLYMSLRSFFNLTYWSLSWPPYNPPKLNVQVLTKGGKPAGGVVVTEPSGLTGNRTFHIYFYPWG